MPNSKNDNKIDSLVVLSFEGRHFSFEAVGHTRSEAEAALLKGWERHREQAGADRAITMPKATFQELEAAFSIEERILTTGGFYRDHELVTLV